MGMLEFLGLRESRPAGPAATETAALSAQVEILQESLADLELALEDDGWDRLTAQNDREMSREGLGRAATVARVMAVANPLIKRGLGIRQAYVWGQGVQVAARANGKDAGEQDVNALVQTFWNDPGNRAAFTGDQAQEENERSLGTDGNVFLACFTNPRTGFVQVRSILFDEIVDIITNPDDRDDPWFYHRRWNERHIDLATGQIVTQQREAYYPALRYRPRSRPRALNGIEVVWDAPVYHVSVNRLNGNTFGIGDAYAALTWARAYRDFLADWAVLVKSLSQFAWRLSTGKTSKSQALRQRLARRPAGPGPDGNPNSIGATATTGEGVTLEAIPKTGATIDSESGRPLAAMVAAALDVPVTTLLADPGQTGARAVAETLNLPTRLAMQQRQSVWAEAIRAILAYAILQAVKTPQGPLRGTVTRDPFTGQERVALAGDTDDTIEVTFPSLEESVPVRELVEAIVKADATQKIPPVEIAKLLLGAFGVKDADGIIDSLTDDDGNWLDPYATVGQGVADAALAAFRRGEDPARVVGANNGAPDDADPEDPDLEDVDDEDA